MRKSVAYLLIAAFMLAIACAGVSIGTELAAEMREAIAYREFQEYCKTDGALCVHRPDGCTADLIRDC